MDRPIQVGDLVLVARGHDCALGFTFRVARFNRQTGGGWFCPRCNTRDLGKEEIVGASMHEKVYGGFPVGWLKRIPPLSELEGTKTDEPIKETA